MSGAAYFVISAKIKNEAKEFKYYMKTCLFNIVQNEAYRNTDISWI